MNCTTRPLEPLKKSERSLLERLEKVIEVAREAFLSAGEALRDIRDQRLYREQFTNFEAYCNVRWKLGKSQVHRLIEAAGVMEDLSPMGEFLPETERQCRPLARIEVKEDRQAVWNEASNGGTVQPTPAKIQELAAKALATLKPEEAKKIVQADEDKAAKAVARNEAAAKAVKCVKSEDCAKKGMAQLDSAVMWWTRAGNHAVAAGAMSSRARKCYDGFLKIVGQFRDRFEAESRAAA